MGVLEKPWIFLSIKEWEPWPSVRTICLKRWLLNSLVSSDNSCVALDLLLCMIVWDVSSLYCCSPLLDVKNYLILSTYSFCDIHFPGFLQVRENWKKSWNLSGQGKVKRSGKIFFWKSQGKWRFGATRCQVFGLKCIKFDFGWGSTPDPTGGAYSAPP